MEFRLSSETFLIGSLALAMLLFAGVLAALASISRN
jgi:hypothetical protein